MKTPVWDGDEESLRKQRAKLSKIKAELTLKMKFQEAPNRITGNN